MNIRRRFAFSLVLALGLWATLSFVQSNSVGAANGSKGAPAVTFNRDVAPIFFKSCAECHRHGETAPFSVLSYKDARPWAKSIREKVANRTMPPWHADPHVGAWANDRRLTEAVAEDEAESY